jgi:secreted PhoX family phosphatase
MSLGRRNFLRRATGLAALSMIPVPLIGLTTCSVRRAIRRAGPGEGGYGELVPGRDCPELALPPDFRAVRLSVSGERMSDGVSTPGDFDGMAAFPLPNGHVRLVRNRAPPPGESGEGVRRHRRRRNDVTGGAHRP